MTTLAHLRPGQQAVIQGIHAEEHLFHRLAALGFRIGKKIELIRRASFNGPLHVRIGSTDIILRQSEADHVEIN